jgi:hypothetical protein
VPVENRVTKETVEHDAVKEDWPELLPPDPLLLGSSRRLAELLDVARDAGEEEGNLGKTERPTRIAPKVKVAFKLVGVGFPVSVGVAGYISNNVM